MTTQCGCGFQAFSLPRTSGRLDAPWTDGVVPTILGDVPRVRATLGLRDWLGTLAARTGVGRMRYRVSPGLYAVGAPRPRPRSSSRPTAS